jgi:nucleoside-diphosphate-sugar epimerase
MSSRVCAPRALFLNHPFDLVTGGCGFVGRHLVKSLLAEQRSLLIVDDLSTGRHPAMWLDAVDGPRRLLAGVDLFVMGPDHYVLFARSDLIAWLLQKWQQLRIAGLVLGDVYHLASVVGGRATIDGDPLSVAIDLGIDAVFFRWLARNRDRIDRVLYASSSAAYPTALQAEEGAVALEEGMIAFGHDLGQPDMTYGWSKLTGEYLARIASTSYGVHIACVRPFSGYGGDQDQTYPVPAIARRAARHDDPLVVWGSGRQGRDFVHIDDCIAGIRRATAAIDDGRAVNIGTGRLMTFLDVAATFGRLAGYEPHVQPLIDRPVGVAARYADVRYMREVLQWSPIISAEAGFARVLQEQAALLRQETETHASLLRWPRKIMEARHVGPDIPDYS